MYQVRRITIPIALLTVPKRKGYSPKELAESLSTYALAGVISALLGTCDVVEAAETAAGGLKNVSASTLCQVGQVYSANFCKCFLIVVLLMNRLPQLVI